MNRVQQINQARKILHDWLGEGCNPVPIEQAQARADVCLNGDPMVQKDGTHRCRCNYQGSWMWALGTAMAIASQLRLRETMAIKLNGERKLKTCEICGCNLKLKVHVPIKHTYTHTSDQMMNRFPSHCWIRKEITELITNTK